MGNLAQALKRIDVEGIAHGFVKDPLEAIREIAQRRVDCLIGLPSQVLSIAKHGEASEIPPGQIKGVLLSPDACMKSPNVSAAVSNELRRIWNCPVFHHYGTTEMGFGGGVECQACSGYHLREADLYFEIINPDSGQTKSSGAVRRNNCHNADPKRDAPCPLPNRSSREIFH